MARLLGDAFDDLSRRVEKFDTRLAIGTDLEQEPRLPILVGEAHDRLFGGLAREKALDPPAAIRRRIGAHLFADPVLSGGVRRRGGGRAPFHQRLDRPAGTHPDAQPPGALARALAIPTGRAPGKERT